MTIENSLNFQQGDNGLGKEIVVPGHKEDKGESGKRISDIEGALKILEEEDEGGDEDITSSTLQ